ncbi:SGNH/GDSL hydrolase family protein [Stenotrophomonas sp.]|uniref:SGNH/GDSL hydrolase family protein n=1 Tax=Stenotrophomonas sp. TaxID=69392 RepID=UPI0028AE2C10|nr:SGNH/GDSL hydrolase family protein [Stenotrophomonas sp.]
MAILVSFAASASPPIDETTRQIVIEEYGDSTTVGYTATSAGTIIAAINEPNTLQRLLREEFGEQVVVRNMGIGGIQSSDALHGTDGIHQAWDSVMKTSHAQIVTLNFGLNDAFFFSKPAEGKASVSPAEFKQVMLELVTIAQRNGKKVVLYEPNPSCHPAREQSLKYYVTHLDELASEKSIPLVSQYWTFANDPNWRTKLSDCTHPIPAIYEMKGQNAYRVLRTIVNEMATASEVNKRN